MPVSAPGRVELSPVAASCLLYEQDILRQATGETLRPGGVGLTALLLAQCELPPEACVLDIGCGCGASLAWLQGKQATRATGVDYSMPLLREAALRHVSVARALAGCLPFPAASFDAAILECSLSVIALQETDETGPGAWTTLSVLEEARRVLRPAGWLLLSDLYARRPEGIPALRALPGTSCLRGVLDLPAVQHKLQTLGFEICFWEDHSEALHPLSSQLHQANGTLQTFWDQALGKTVDAFDLAIKIGRAKPGYFILLARKSAGHTLSDSN